MRGRCLVWLTVALGATPAFAEPVHVPYRATLGVVEIAAGALTIETAGGQYQLSLDGIVARSDARKVVRAKAHAVGRFGRRSAPLAPDLYTADFDNAGTRTRVGLGFANSALGLVAVLPPGPKGSGQTRPAPNESTGLLDPLSALVIPAAPAPLAPLSACGRTQRVFDGFRRYDLTLFPSRSEVAILAGTPLVSLVCRAELRTAIRPPTRRPPLERWPQGPSLGHPALVWLAPVADGRLLAPTRIEAKLGFGTLTIEATDAHAFRAALLTAAP